MEIQIGPSTVFEKAPDSVMIEIKKLIIANHPELLESKANVGCLFKEKRDDNGRRAEGSCLKLHGYPCYATIKINSNKDRVEGKPDATITVDGNVWDTLRDDQKTAILDHELEHLIVRREGGGEQAPFRFDDMGRPLMKMRMHDQQFGWFNVIAKRHGDASIEVGQAKSFADKFGQLYFGWKTPPKRPVESARDEKKAK